MNQEYDFRFPALSGITPSDKENASRVKSVRAAILKTAGGFTEIPPGICTDMLPGDGMGYIVGLDSEDKFLELEKALQRLAKEWKLSAPVLREAAKGPRGAFSFALIPELANPDPQGYRRPLFREDRWTKIEETFGGGSPFRIELVYGEWLPEGSNKPMKDPARMFVVAGSSSTILKRLERIIRADVFDGGIDCDQICIYVSCGGMSNYVVEE